MGTRLGLNLACGNKIYESTDEITWVNVDKKNNHYNVVPDVDCDVRKLPFEDDYADVIEAIHIFEHFYIWEVDAILKEWKRVLKPEGQLILELPCMNKIIQNFIDKKDASMTWGGIFGEQIEEFPEMAHKWCYSKGQLGNLLTQSGFKDVTDEPVQYHKPDRDMRFTARKQ